MTALLFIGLTILALVYIFSVAGTYEYMKEAHSPKGIYYRFDRDWVEETVMAFLPVSNTMFTIAFLRGKCIKKVPLESKLADEEEDDYYKVRE